MKKSPWIADAIYSTVIATALCATAAVYVEAGYSVADQTISIISFWATLLLPIGFARKRDQHTSVTAHGDIFSGLLLVLVTAAFSFLPVVRSINYDSQSDQFLTAAYTLAVFSTALIFLLHVRFCGLRLLFGGFVMASLICPVGYLWIARGQLGEIATVQRRFSTDGMHPNLLGFCSLGFACISAAAFILSKSKWRWIFPFSGLLSLVTIYIASSRGSIIGFVAAFTTALILLAVRDFKNAMNGVNRASVRIAIGVSAGFALMLFTLANFYSLAESEIGQEVATRLELFSSYRGMGTGLTGRVDTWKWVYSQYNAADYWLGVGPRKSGMLAGDIDNGYIVMILENGLVASSIILLRFLSTFAYFVGVAVNTKDEFEFRLALALVFISAAFFTNNLTARYLWGIGNPFCLFGIALFALGPEILTRGFLELKARKVDAAPKIQGARFYRNLQKFPIQ